MRHIRPSGRHPGEFALRVFLCAGGALAFFVAILALAARCAVVPPDPTPDRPRVGCIADSPLAPMQRRAPGGARLLPEVVRVIGTTSFEDGERWMVIRGVYIAANCKGANVYDREKCDWQPFAREAIQFHGCGPEAAIAMDLMRAAESSQPFEPRSDQ